MTEPGGLFAGSPFPGISSTATNAPGKNVVANVSWTISPTVVSEAAFNYSWGAGHFGTAGRGLFLGPGQENWDLAGIRNFKLSERASL